MLYAKYEYIQKLKEEQAYLETITHTKSGRKILRRLIGGRYYYYYNTVIDGKRCQRTATEAEYTKQVKCMWALRQLETVEKELAFEEDRMGNFHKSLTEEFQKIVALPKPPSGQQTFRPDELIYTTLRGERVRSKSEALIADALYRHGIAYSYEEPLAFDNRYHIDFTIKNNLHGFPIYWEHFGAMNNSSYVKNFLEKKAYYSTLGILENKNLIATFEYFDSAGHPVIVFDSHKADDIVMKWFMPPPGGFR